MLLLSIPLLLLLLLSILIQNLSISSYYVVSSFSLNYCHQFHPSLSSQQNTIFSTTNFYNNNNNHFDRNYYLTRHCRRQQQRQRKESTILFLSLNDNDDNNSNKNRSNNQDRAVITNLVGDKVNEQKDDNVVIIDSNSQISTSNVNVATTGSPSETSIESVLLSTTTREIQSRLQQQKQKSSVSLPSAVSSKDQSTIEWEVYVDQSKLSLDRGGSATLDAFIALAIPTTIVTVQGAIFPNPIKNTKSTRSPAVRCIAINVPNDNDSTSTTTTTSTKRKRISGSTISIDIGNVDSVDKVHRILTKYMLIPNVSLQACECLKWKYKGNGYLEGGKIDLAIDAYDKALAIARAVNNNDNNAGTAAIAASTGNQEGIILLMRATAYLQRAALHRNELKSIVNDLASIVPNSKTYQNLYQLCINNNEQQYIANSIFRKIVYDTTIQEEQFRIIQYKHGLYQYSLIHAAQDALLSTTLLNNYTLCYIKTGEILNELWKIQQSILYYNKSIEIDTTLYETITPIITKLYKRQNLLKDAKNYGWSEDTLRLALDVAR